MRPLSYFIGPDEICPPVVICHWDEPLWGLICQPVCRSFAVGSARVLIVDRASVLWGLMAAEKQPSTDDKNPDSKTARPANGEIVVPNEDGTTDFSQLQRALKASKTSDKLAMYCFDLLNLDGGDLRGLPLTERKAVLQRLIAMTDLLYSEHFDVTGTELYKSACGMGLKGIVSKQRDGKYRSGGTGSRFGGVPRCGTSAEFGPAALRKEQRAGRGIKVPWISR